MDQKYGEFVGVDSVYFALVTSDTEAGYVAGMPQYLAPVGEIAGQPEINNLTTYYDNRAANSYVTEGKTELKLTLSNVPGNIAALLLGKKYDETTGRVYDSGEANPPDVALGFRYNMGKAGYRYYWYLKGVFSGGAEDASTKKENIEAKTYQLTFEAVTTVKQWTVKGALIALKRVFADTADAAFSATGWFSQVQTPDTTTPPSAIQLSTIVPADGATSVSRTTTIVLTFSNKISRESVVLLNSSTGDSVEVSRAWDSAGKVLTLTPATQLAASTKFIVAVAGVVDVFGQTLAAVGKDFTTAA